MRKVSEGGWGGVVDPLWSGVTYHVKTAEPCNDTSKKETHLSHESRPDVNSWIPFVSGKGGRRRRGGGGGGKGGWKFEGGRKENGPGV